MILKPQNSSSKCGILNEFYHSKNSKLLYFIPENAHSEPYYNRIQTVIDCTVDSDWPSSKGNRYFTINLLQHIIKPSHVSVTRRNNFIYHTFIEIISK